MSDWNELSTDQKVDQLKKSLTQWNNLMAPRLSELREVIEAQERLIERLMRRIEALECGKLEAGSDLDTLN